MTIENNNRAAHLARASGHSYKKKKQYSEALSEYETALTLFRGDNKALAGIYSEIARIYLEQKKYGLSIIEAEKAIGLNSENEHAHMTLAMVYKEEKQFDEALAEYAKALKCCGNNTESESNIRSEIAQVYFEQKRHGLSIAELKKSLKLKKENIHAHIRLGKAYQENKQYEEGLAVYREAQKFCCNDKKALSNIHNEMARIYLEQKKYDLSIIEFRKVIELNSENEHAHMTLTMMHKEKKHYGEALAEYDQALKRCGDNTEAESNIRKEIAQIYFKHGYCKELEKVVELGAEQTHLLSGIIYEGQENYSLAENEYKEAVKIKPSSNNFRELIRIYKKQKKIDLCVEANNKYLNMQEKKDPLNNRKFEQRIKALGRNLPGSALKVKIIRMPSFEPRQKGALNYSLLLPVGMGQIVSYLRTNGMPVDQDDLYVKINHDNMFGKPEDKIDMDIFWDEKRILEYSSGKEDGHIDALMQKAEDKTELAGYSVILLSVPGEIENSGANLFVMAFARYLKAKYNPLIIAGGCKIDSLVKYDARHIDFIGIGKGEKLLFMVLTALKYKVSIDETLPLNIEGKIIRSTENAPFGLLPDYTGLPLDLYQYRTPGSICNANAEVNTIVTEFNNSKITIVPHILIEGCFYECIFCGSSNTRDLFILSPKKAVECLRHIKEKYGIKYFFFLNPLINISKKYINDFCGEIINSKLDILWTDCARADNIDRDMLLKMRKAGCIRLIYGLETASPKLLKYIEKNISLKRLEDILRFTDEAGILTGLEIICGFPGETQEDLQMTVDFINKNKAHLNFIYCNILFMDKGSKLYLSPGKYGIKNVAQVNYRENELRDLKFGYDEVDGLCWKERLNYMIKAYDLLEKTRKEGFNFLSYVNEHLMFYLYSKFNDKKKVVNIYNEITKVMA